MKIFRPLSVVIMGIFYLISIFIENEFLDYVIAFFTILILLSFIKYLNKISLIMVIFLVGLSLIIYMSTNNFDELINGLTMNTSLLAIFIFVPLLSLPIKSKRYIKEIEIFLINSFSNSKQFYNYIKLSAFFMGAFLSVGALSILYSITELNEFRKLKFTKLKALNRGFSLAFLWSPYFISIAVILSYFEVEWVEIAFYGLLLSIFSIAYEIFNFKGMEIEIPNVNGQIPYDRNKIIELIIIIITMTLILISTDMLSNFSILSLIPVVSTVTFLIWTFYIDGLEGILKGLWNFTQEKIPNMGNELLLFISAGLFGTSIIAGGFDKILLEILKYTGVNHVLLLIPIFGLIIVGFSIVSIHPIVTVTVISLVINSLDNDNNTHIYFSMGLLLSWMITINISPFSGLNLILSNLSKENLLSIGMKSNIRYALGMGIVGYIIIILLYLINVF